MEVREMCETAVANVGAERRDAVEVRLGSTLDLWPTWVRREVQLADEDQAAGLDGTGAQGGRGGQRK